MQNLIGYMLSAMICGALGLAGFSLIGDGWIPFGAVLGALIGLWIKMEAKKQA